MKGARVLAFAVERVEYMLDQLRFGVLYVSERFSTAIHLCACGCGIETVTPLNSDGWDLTWSNGEATLHPSIGNRQLECRSHYYIRRNVVLWL